MTALPESAVQGWELFARYAFPPNELGYCGPPDASVLLTGNGHDAVAGHAQGFDGAWPYLQEIATAAGVADPLDADVVRSYWLGGPLLERVDGVRLVDRLRQDFAGQPTGLLNELRAADAGLAHHSFHVFVVYPWVRLLISGNADPATPLRILQACRIRWGTVESVDDEHAVIMSRPLRFVDGHLELGDAVGETVRWSKDGTSLAPLPSPGDTVAAHWDWICGAIDADEEKALAAATRSSIDLVNRARR